MIIDSALYLASIGFHVFPLCPGSKKPMFRGWCEDATCDAERVEKIWKMYPTANIGILSSYYTNGTLWYGCNIDVDNKNGRRGTDSAIKLGALLPETFVQRTPTGGYHYMYKSHVAVRNAVGDLAEGLDTRGWHGYVVGAGSIVPMGTYTVALAGPVVEAPQGLLDLIGRADTAQVRRGTAPSPTGIEVENALRWAREFLESLPVAVDGTINNSAFAAAARLRDRGLAPVDIYGAMTQYFKSELEMDEDELWGIANHVYQYAKGVAGSAAPELIFKEALQQPNPVERTETTPAETSASAFDWFNQDHAVCLIGSACFVLKRGTTSRGKPMLHVMGLDAFHTINAGKTYTDGEGKTKSMSRAWMGSKNRPTFYGLDFAPGRELPPTHYNLWQGFAFEPQRVGSERAHKALEDFKYHLLHNICNGDKDLCHYVTSFFAHLYQKPQDKEPISLVFRGEKGSGKDTMINIIGAPLGLHFMSTSRGSDLTGQFNGAVESKLLCVYNEAFWAHDHKAASVLKDLISGNVIRIERKGCEPYWVDNLSRTVIMGNDDVLVPATHDERRWVVIDTRDIPDKEKASHKAFCTEMRKGMEAGGYHLLVDYLLTYDISGVEIGIAPNTQGLVDQKLAGLTPVQMFFGECLHAGAIVSCGVPMGWPEKIDKEILRQAFRRWRKDRDITGREPGEDAIGRQIAKMKLGIDGSCKRTEGKHQVNCYGLPPLEEARKAWDVFVKVVKPTKW